MARLENLQKLLDITHDQTKALEKNDIDLFNNLMAIRQGILDDILTEQAIKLEENEKAIIEIITKLDKKHQETIQKKYDYAKQELGTVRKRKKPIEMYELGYYQPLQNQGAYFDEREQKPE